MQYSSLRSAECDRRAWPPTVALSISAAEDSGRFGLKHTHLDTAFAELCRSLADSGMRLAYGGHWKAGGYTKRLLEVVRSAPGFIAYVPWPASSQEDGPTSGPPWVEVRPGERPSDLDEALDPTLVPSGVDVASDSPMGRLVWARGLSVMRQCQTAEVAARVVIGGRIGTAGGYLGRMPGVLEEALLSLRAGQPTYLVGAFGGCARLIVDALDGVWRRELAWDYHRVVPHSQLLRRLYAARGLSWDEYEAVASELAKIGFVGLDNGLTVEENRELAGSRSGQRIAELVLRGLEQCYPSPQASSG